MDFEYIDESEVSGVRRGRKSEVPAEMVEAFRNAPVGKAVSLRDYQHDPKSEDYKNHKARVSSSIRSAGKNAGKSVKITWTEAGFPQVTLSPLTAGKRKK